MHEWTLDERGLPMGYRLRSSFEIAPRDARDLLASGACVLIDCRTPEEYACVRIEGAELIPLGEIEQRADEIDADDETPVLVICHHGVRSRRAALALQQLGFPQARSIVGGIDLWAVAIDPCLPRYERTGGGVRVVDDGQSS